MGEHIDTAMQCRDGFLKKQCSRSRIAFNGANAVATVATDRRLKLQLPRATVKETDAYTITSTPVATHGWRQARVWPAADGGDVQQWRFGGFVITPEEFIVVDARQYPQNRLQHLEDLAEQANFIRCVLGLVRDGKSILALVVDDVIRLVAC